MRILFTGASSFTGMWFVKTLVEAGHNVVAPLKSSKEAYKSLRLERIQALMPHADVRFSIPYGSESFDHLLELESFDLFCHHASDVTNYKSPDFDPISALKNNAGNLPEILKALKKKGCSKLVLTGSVFEQNEGAGSDDLRAVSPYGLSKGLTADLFKYYSSVYQFSLGKFVIPNPFGPFEEFRFTSFLIKNWFEKKQVEVSQPSYVRDNIPVSLLAKAYQSFVEGLSTTPGFKKINPSGYIQAQGDFTMRFSNEMKKRLNLPCEYKCLEQTAFPEPKVRTNTDLLDTQALNWNEALAWDNLAAYYETIYAQNAVK